MTYGERPGLDKQVSRLVMGVDNQQTLTHAATMFDDFVERGGTTFDTAYIYGGGRGEKLLGQWMTNRGNRDEVVVIGKGAHTPHCDPESISRQLPESLERLQTDHVDLYLMHRDNEDIAGRRVRRRARRTPPGRAHHGVRRFQLVARRGSTRPTSTPSGRQAAVHAAEQPPQPGPRVRRSRGTGAGTSADSESQAWLRAAAGRAVPVVEPGARVLHREGEAGGPFGRGARPVLLLRRATSNGWTGPANSHRPVGWSRPRSRWRGCCTSRTRCSR